MSADANLAALLVERARATPAAIALYAVERGKNRAVSFAELTEISARGAALLETCGLHAGDTVLVFQPVSIDLYVALLAIFRLGLQAMFADPSSGSAQLARCCALGRPRAFLGPPRAHALRLMCGALRRIEVSICTGGWLPGMVRWGSLSTLSPLEKIVPAAPDAPALLTFTSGSTGQPKAAVRTHGFLRAQHLALEETLALAPGQTDLATLPIFVLANLASGVASVLPDADLRRPGSVRTSPLARQIRRLHPDRTTASPAFLERLLQAKVPLGGFRKIYTGGAPVFPDLLARLRAAVAPEAEIVAVYGSTEAEPMAHLSDRDISPADLASMRTGSGLLAGSPVASACLRIVTDRAGVPLGELSAAEFDALLCPAGAPGEIVVTGEHVLKGYLHGLGDQETKFQVAGEIWHRTGDAGRLDPAGRLWLLGRCAARVSDARGVQYPLAVECAARLISPEVRRCAFVAFRGRRCLLIEDRNSLPAREHDHLKAALEWAALDEVRRVRRIPMDRRHNAKIDYPALLKLLR